MRLPARGRTITTASVEPCAPLSLLSAKCRPRQTPIFPTSGSAANVVGGSSTLQYLPTAPTAIMPAAILALLIGARQPTKVIINQETSHYLNISLPLAVDRLTSKRKPKPRLLLIRTPRGLGIFDTMKRVFHKTSTD